MYRFVHAERALREACRWEHADRAGDHARLVRKNVAEEIARHKYIELLRIVYQLHRRIVDVEVFESDLRIFLCHARHRLSPKPRALQHVRLIDAGDLFVSFHRHLESNLRDAFHFFFGVLLHVVSCQPHIRCFFRAAFAEVNAAGQFSDHQQIQTARHLLRFERTSVPERIEHDGRSEIRKQTEFLAKSQERPFRPLCTRQAVPLRSADRAEQHCIALLRFLYGFLRQTLSAGVDGITARL